MAVPLPAPETQRLDKHVIAPLHITQITVESKINTIHIRAYTVKKCILLLQIPPYIGSTNL